MSEAPAPEPSLDQVLAAREARVLRQRVLAAEHGWPVLSVGVLTPGPAKDTLLSRSLFAAATDAVAAVLTTNGVPVADAEERLLATGPELLAALPGAEPARAKRVLVELEEEHPLGRLWDLDVVGSDGPLSRGDIGLPGRRCLLCDEPSPVCARSRAHAIPELLAEMQRRYDAWAAS